MLLLRVVRPREAKVGQLELPIVANEQVGAFDIAMQHLLSVAVCQALEELLHVTLNLRDGELLSRISQTR